MAFWTFAGIPAFFDEDKMNTDRDMTSSSPLMPAVSLTLDIVPLLLGAAFVLCATSFLIALRQRGVAVYKLYWALGTVLAIVGLLLIVLREGLPPWLSVLLGNCLLLMGEACLVCGTRRYINRRFRFDVLIGGAAVSAFTTAYLLDADVALRALIYTLFCAYFAGRVAVSFIHSKRRWPDWSAGSVAALLCCIELGRAALLYSDVLSDGGKTALNGFSVTLGVSLAVILAGVVVALNWELLVQTFKGKQPMVAKRAPLPLTTEGAVAESMLASWGLVAERSLLLTPDGHALPLTANEYMVLHKLSEVGDIVDRLTLNSVIGRSTLDPKDRGIDVLISRLRRKCADAGHVLPLNALRGRGYIFMGELRRQ